MTAPVFDLGDLVEVRKSTRFGGTFPAVVCGVYPHDPRHVDVRTDKGATFAGVPVSRLTLNGGDRMSRAFTPGHVVDVLGAYPGQRQSARIVGQDGSRIMVRYLSTDALREVAASRVRVRPIPAQVAAWHAAEGCCRSGRAEGCCICDDGVPCEDAVAAAAEWAQVTA